MRTGTVAGLVTLGLVTSIAHSAFCQEIIWTQPYSGNTVYGPFASSPGEIPNCPECECEACQPSGCRGLFKRFWDGVSDKFRRDRREFYFCKQTYHTMYTPPVLPPYCEPGFGYYETTWRQPLPCDPTLGYSIESGLPLEAPLPVPSDVQIPPPAPSGSENKEVPENLNGESPGGQQLNDKPPYEETSPPQASVQWQPVYRPAASQTFPAPVIIPKQ